MKNKRRIISLIACIGFLFLGSLAYSQAQQNNDFSIVGFETGFMLGYNVNGMNQGSGQMFSLRASVGNNLDVGFFNVSNVAAPVTAYKMLTIGYGIADRFGLSVYLGSDGANNAGGFDISVNAFERAFQNTFNTALKMRIFYLFALNSFTTGNFGVMMTLNFGI